MDPHPDDPNGHRTGHRTHRLSRSPLAAAWLGDLRDPSCDLPRFRRRTRQLARLLAHQAAGDLEWVPDRVRTALGEHAGTVRLAGPAPVVVPPLRAGLAMLDGVLDVFEDAAVVPVGLARDEHTLEPHWYLSASGDLRGAPVLVCDPMLATAGTVIAVGDRLVEHGAGAVAVLSLIAAPEGLARLADSRPSWWVHTASVDRELDDRGFIRPGLGDAGDRWCDHPSRP